MSEEIRTYNGKPQADWIVYEGAYFATPLGQTFTGDLDLATNQGSAVPGSVHIENLRLSVTFDVP